MYSFRTGDMEFTSLSGSSLDRIALQQWDPIQPTLCTKLGDSRRQFHHAAQFATAAGISFLPAQPDDSHTNLEWLSEFHALFSHEIPGAKPFRIGVRPADLTLIVLSSTFETVAVLDLNGRTIRDATLWLTDRMAALGADASRFTLQRHYEIPFHAVAKGDAFDSTARTSFEELARWFANGFRTLNELALRTPRSSEVRCWPHHFDIGTLISIGSGRSIGVGLEPGDDYYDEPYFYVNMTPQPIAEQVGSRRLAGNGSWHIDDWIGAVLPGSRFREDASQDSQVAEFLDSAVTAAREIIEPD